MNIPIPDPKSDASDLLPLTILEPFGWIFTPGPLPPDAISAEAALSAAGMPANGLTENEISIESGAYTEKGRYRQEEGEKPITHDREV